MEFGERLKARRKEMGMTQQMLADQLYVTKQTVSGWECGTRLPDVNLVIKIAKVLEISLEEFLL